MQYIRLRSRGSTVSFLQELLGVSGYDIPASGFFGLETEVAVKDFQMKNQQILDGEVGIKTCTLLFDKTKSAYVFEIIFLGEHDRIDFAKRYKLDLAFDRTHKILYVGHVFRRQLNARGINPEDFFNSLNETVLYKKNTKNHFLGGSREYERLEQAATISSDPKFREAALASTSWGSYQVMGFHAIPLGYPSVQQFVDEMYKKERIHLEVFGLYILKNGCIDYLWAKNWAKFAVRNDGAGYATNKYDEKMATAYLKFSTD